MPTPAMVKLGGNLALHAQRLLGGCTFSVRISTFCGQFASFLRQCAVLSKAWYGTATTDVTLTGAHDTLTAFTNAAELTIGVGVPEGRLATRQMHISVPT